MVNVGRYLIHGAYGYCKDPEIDTCSKFFLSWLLAENGFGIVLFGSIPTQPKQTKMVLMPLPFQCVIK